MDVLTFYNKQIGVFCEYNLTLKKYSDNLVKYKRSSYSVFKGIPYHNRHTGTTSIKELEERSKKYLRKVKNEIIDLSYNNKDNFEYFITLTFSPSEFTKGEYSHEEAIDLLKKWINNQKHQNRNMSYILVPEFHKKSGHLHFHGLIGNVPKWKFSKAVNPHTGKLIKLNNTQIYNLDNYKLGFTTVSKIKSKEKVTNYISKYATKELISLKNKKRYWYSRDLVKPVTEYAYIDTNLTDYLSTENVIYQDVFERDNCSIELASTL